MIHDAWRSDPQTPHPVLWVGRTVFSRAPTRALVPELPASIVDPNGELLQRGSEDPLADEQSAAPSGSHPAGDNNPSKLEHRRGAPTHRGQEEGVQRDGHGSEGTRVHDEGPVDRGVCQTGNHAAGGCDERPHAVVDPGFHDGGKRELSGDVWKAPRKARQRSAESLPGVVHHGDCGKREGRMRPGPCQSGVVCGNGATQEDDQGLQSGGGPSGPAPTGRCLGEFSLGVRIWSALTSMAKSMNESVESRQRPFPPKAAPKRPQDPVENDRMHQEIPPEAKARGRGPDDTPGGTQRSVQFVEELDGSQSELEDDDSPDALEFEIQSPPIHVLPGARDEDVTSGETFYECQETAPRATCGETNEHRARDLLRRKDFSFSACEGLLEQVCKDCQASRKRKINEGTCSVAFGGYRHGCHYGVIKRTYQHWYMTKYVNEFMRFHGAQGQWSSLPAVFQLPYWSP